MEQNNTKPIIDLSFYSILKMFKGKLKFLVVLGIIAALLGGSIGAVTVTMGQKIYGTTLAYYLPTAEQSGYSNILPLLESDLFTEKVLIGYEVYPYTFTDEDNNEKTVNVNIPKLPYSSEDQKKEVANYEYTKSQKNQKIKELKDELKEIPFKLNILKANLDEKTTAYESLAELLSIYTATASDSLSKMMEERITRIENELNAALIAKTTAENEYNTCLNRQHKADEELFKLENELLKVNETSDKLLYDLRLEWKASDQNKKLMEIVHSNIVYSFNKDGSPVLEVTQTQEIQTSRFLYILVSIPENETLANEIIHNITKELPEFIVSNSTPTEKNDKIECINVTSGEAKNLNQDKLLTNILKFALIAFLAIEALAVIAIISSNIKRTLFPKEPKEITADQIEENHTDGEISDGNDK